MTNPRKRSNQRGSALLIVFVMAAIIAVMLYRALPIAAFEAQRQKEELTVARGGEYKRAVKLFVRKFGRFPTTIAELESTNRMRFLRRKYTDPLTGKDDWRLVHAGPGGIITDSMVKDTSKTGKPGDASTLGAAAAFAGFNNSIVHTDPDADLASAPSAALRQRPAATVNAGSIAGGNGELPLPSATAEASSFPGVGAGQGLYPDGSNPAPNVNPTLSGTGQQIPGAAGQPASGLTTLANDPQVQAAMASAGMGNGIGAAGPGNSSVAQQLNTQNPLTPQGPPSANGLQNTGAFQNGGQANGQQQNGQGLMAVGGIAGVASKAAGASIKLVNDQKKYSLWEFYYDMRKDQSANAAAALQQMQQPGAAQNTQNGANNSNSAFGSSTSNSSFGFGSSQQNNTPQTPPAQQPIPIITPPPSSPQ